MHSDKTLQAIFLWVWSFGSSLNFFSCKLFWFSTILTHDYHQFSAVFTSVQPANCFDYELLKSILSKTTAIYCPTYWHWSQRLMMQRSDRVDATHLTLATWFSKLVLKSGRDDCFKLMVLTMYYVSQWVPPILHAMLQRNCPSHYANAFGELGFDCMMKIVPAPCSRTLNPTGLHHWVTNWPYWFPGKVHFCVWYLSLNLYFFGKAESSLVKLVLIVQVIPSFRNGIVICGAELGFYFFRSTLECCSTVCNFNANWLKGLFLQVRSDDLHRIHYYLNNYLWIWSEFSNFPTCANNVKHHSSKLFVCQQTYGWMCDPPNHVKMFRGVRLQVGGMNHRHGDWLSDFYEL